MAENLNIGNLHFSTITRDEIAMLVRSSLLYALTPEGANEAQLVRGTALATLPLLRTVQIDVVLNAFAKGEPLTKEWQTFIAAFEAARN